MGKAKQISSAFWFALAVIVLYDSKRFGLGTLNHPGPGFLPFCCGLILIGLSMIIFIQATAMHSIEKNGSLRKLWEGVRWSKAIYIVLALLVYVLTFTYFGFLISTFMMLLFLFKAIEHQKWSVAVLEAILASIISFLVFGLWLDVQFPRGIIEEIFF